MPDGSRIPQPIPLFNSYLNVTDDFLQKVWNAGPPPLTNRERLGLTAQNGTDWHNHRIHWKDDLYPKYTSDSTRTKTVTQQVRNFMESFRAFAIPLIERIAASDAATEQDEQVFNFRRVRKSPSRPTAPIEEQCNAAIRNLGGARIGLSCRTSHDTRRPSLAAGANSVMMAFKIGDPAPSHPEEGTRVVLFSRASAVFDFGAANAGARGYAYFRWYNTKYAHLAGPWSDRKSFVIA